MPPFIPVQELLDLPFQLSDLRKDVDFIHLTFPGKEVIEYLDNFCTSFIQIYEPRITLKKVFSNEGIDYWWYVDRKFFVDEELVYFSKIDHCFNGPGRYTEILIQCSNHPFLLYYFWCVVDELLRSSDVVQVKFRKIRPAGELHINDKEEYFGIYQPFLSDYAHMFNLYPFVRKLDLLDRDYPWEMMESCAETNDPIVADGPVASLKELIFLDNWWKVKERAGKFLCYYSPKVDDPLPPLCTLLHKLVYWSFDYEGKMMKPDSVVVPAKKRFTTAEIRALVQRCKEAQANGMKIKEFYHQEGISKVVALSTFKAYLYNPKYH
jgi:hypothetical protein